MQPCNGDQIDILYDIDLLLCGGSARYPGCCPIPAAAAAGLRGLRAGQSQHGVHGATPDVRGARLRHALLSCAGRIGRTAALQLSLPHANCSQDLRCRTHGLRWLLSSADEL